MSPIIRRVVSAYRPADRSRHVRADARENAGGRDGDGDDAMTILKGKRVVVISFPKAKPLASDYSATLDASARERKRKGGRPKLSYDFEKQRKTTNLLYFFFLENEINEISWNNESIGIIIIGLPPKASCTQLNWAPRSHASTMLF